MRKLFHSAALCAATLLGFAGCSNDPIEVPETRAVAGANDARLNGMIQGPTSIELDQLYTFTAMSNVLSDTFIFTVEDTYFHDPSSYAINVSTTGRAIHVVFNDYGHYKITATNKRTHQTTSYEVAKYYKEVGKLKYWSNAPGLQDNVVSGKPISRRFERYQNYSEPLGFSDIIRNYPQRIVVNVDQYYMEYWYPYRAEPYMKRGITLGTITGIAAKGANTISLPDGVPVTHPEYDPVALENIAFFVPFCTQEYTIPEERCGMLL